MVFNRLNKKSQMIKAFLNTILRILWPQKNDIWIWILWLALVISIIKLVWGFDGELGFVSVIFVILLGWPAVIAYFIHVHDEIKIFKNRENPGLYLGKVKIIFIILFLLLLIITRRDVDSSIKDLKYGSYEHKIEAIEYLVNSNDPRALEPLVIALSDEYDSVRESASEALTKIGIDKLLPAQQAIYYIYTNNSEKAANIGESAIGPLIAALSEETRLFRFRGIAAEALGEIGGPSTVDPLIIALSDESYNVRYAAAEALGKIADPSTVDPLIIALSDESYNVRYAAAKALGKIGDPRAVDPLIIAFNDGNSFVRESVAEALGKIGDPRAFDTFIIKLSQNPNVRNYATKALEKIGIEKLLPVQQAIYYIHKKNYKKAVEIGEPAVDPLIIALSDERYYVRYAAAEALGKIGDPRAVDPLIKTLSDDFISVRETAAEALVTIGIEKLLPVQQATYYIHKKNYKKAAEIGEPAVEPLIVALSDKDSYIRESAAKALGKIGDSQAVEPLIKALDDEAFGVRCYVAEALSNIDKSPNKFLIKRMSDQTNDTWIRIALTLCGHKDSADMVLQNLEQGGYSVDMRCLMLGWLGSQDMLPQLEKLPYGSKLRKAARNQQLNDNDWREVLQKCENDISRLATTLSALSIIDTSFQRQTLVESLCLTYIRLGDIQIIPQLKQLLNKYGSTSLAEDYINCGQSDLESAGRSWAYSHGYSIKSVSGNIRTKWGSDRDKSFSK